MRKESLKTFERDLPQKEEEDCERLKLREETGRERRPPSMATVPVAFVCALCAFVR